MRLYFATIFDINYLSRGLALYESMKRWHNDFVLYVVCMDDKVQEYFSQNRHDGIELITVSEIEDCYNELLAIKETRNYIDYLFTLSPYYPSYILKKDPTIPFICSIDCDQYFFGNAEFLFDDLETHDVLITPHRFSRELTDLLVHGKYNVSFQVFKNSETGNSCLALWRKQCLEWCSDLPEDGKFADQKYLDDWQSHFGDSIKEIDHIGMGLAPWNLSNYKISVRNKNVYVDDQRLILYHYQGLRFVSARVIQSGLAHYHIQPSSCLVQFTLNPIIKALFRHQYKRGMDFISRNPHHQSESLIGLITSRGMFYLIMGLVINLDFIYKFKTKKIALHGICTKLKNVYR